MASGAVTSGAPRVVSLAHVKATAPIAFAPEKKVMAHAGGKITTNKEEATLKFLRKKMDRGEVLTEEQKKIVAKFSFKDGTKSDGADVLETLESVVALKRKDDPELPQLSQNLKKSRFQTTEDGGLVINRGGKGGNKGGAARNIKWNGKGERYKNTSKFGGGRTGGGNVYKSEQQGGGLGIAMLESSLASRR
mmetsp:Transcript_40645/g.82017  ORF Transcript_40645/g.82017 Transcript_40645/m.82017 type:complete len:192 (+) Transcript_40645:71-646(+)